MPIREFEMEPSLHRSCPLPTSVIGPVTNALLAVALSACGGGGGGGSAPAPAPAPVDAVATVAVVPADGASGVKRDAAVVMATPTVTSGAFSSNATTSGLVCDGTTVVAADKALLTGQVLTITPLASNLPSYGSTCVAQGQVVAVGSNGGKQATVPWKTTFTIEAAPKFVCTSLQVAAKVGTLDVCAYPATVSSKGTEFQTAPAGCLVYNTLAVPSSGFSNCWQNLVKTGKVVWKLSPVTMIGNNNRPIIFAGVTSSDGKLSVLTVFQDTGDLMNPSAEIGRQPHEAIDYWYGNTDGYIFKSLSSGVCYQWRWNGPASTNGSVNVWDFARLTCS